MVIKGRARGGPTTLAAHLERRDTNEEVWVRELRGVTARDLKGALREMDCMGSGATSVRTLYHAAINTAPGERLSDEQKLRAADRLERELGFEGQPRIIVEHLKKDREHFHVVFLRIDTDRMIAIPDSHNFRKHEIVARDLEREFGHERVQGVHIGRGGEPRPTRTPGHAEMQQAERSGLSPQQAKEEVTRLWRQVDSGKAFVASARAEGWVVAKGDKRDFVLVDSVGETHSLARRIEGAKAADVRQRMADVDPAGLPTVAEAKAVQRETIVGRTKEKEKAKELGKWPIILKMSAPVGLDSTKPLQLSESHKRPASVHKAAIASGDSLEVAKPKPHRDKRESPPSSKLKDLYAAAATATQRAYEKARSLLGKRKQPTKVSQSNKQPHTPAQPIQRAFPVRALAKHPYTHAANPAPRSPAPPAAAKKKLTREEMDAMIGRQRDRRPERGGPSR